MEIFIPNLSRRMPLSSYCSFLKKDGDQERNVFADFIMMHLVLFSMQKTLMPTYMIIFEDDTYMLKSFHASIKTTMYRTINDISKKIDADKIKSFFLITEMLQYNNKNNEYKELLKITSKERAKLKTSELLCFFKLDRKLEYKSYFFKSDKVDDMEYVASVLNNPHKENHIINFLQPIKSEFIRLNGQQK